MLDNINTPKLRALLYGLIVLSSLAVFGNIAELCDIADVCPARLAVIIAIGVFTSIIGALAFIATLLEVSVLVSLEFLLSILLVVSFSVCVGLASSFRTKIQETIALSFAWVGLVLSFIVTFLALIVEGGVLRSEMIFGLKGRDLEVGEEVPERNYMEAMDETKNETSEVEASDPSKQEPMVALEQKKGSWLS